ncbi:MAG: ATP-dependent Clp protease adaptor ClpS [Phycisphaerales bacterium]|nr:MAG: ATP-dependent Clp protease adaptor ClpS [Phycisphaerales bacterium]
MNDQAPATTQTPKVTPATRTDARPRPKRQWLWNVVLLDDDHHTDVYVVRMMQELFHKKPADGLRVAVEVDTQGRAVCLTTHKELAELKRDQIHAYGRDPLIASCAGAMRAVIEPAEGSGDDDPDNRD